MYCLAWSDSKGDLILGPRRLRGPATRISHRPPTHVAFVPLWGSEEPCGSAQCTYNVDRLTSIISEVGQPNRAPFVHYIHPLESRTPWRLGNQTEHHLCIIYTHWSQGHLGSWATKQSTICALYTPTGVEDTLEVGQPNRAPFVHYIHPLESRTPWRLGNQTEHHLCIIYAHWSRGHLGSWAIKHSTICALYTPTGVEDTLEVGQSNRAPFVHYIRPLESRTPWRLGNQTEHHLCHPLESRTPRRS